MIAKLTAGRPASFWVALVLIFTAASAALAWVFWPQQAILFSNLSAADAAQITQRLDQQKLPYSLSSDGSTIHMQQELIPKARLQVFSEQIDLKQGVGLEVFSGNDLGMTEFSQHVNFIRALQGELTRTLMAIEGVQSARVHVSLPEGGTRRSNSVPPKVAITLDSATAIDPGVVRGVQRLVAAAVPGAAPENVVILDGKGNLLTSSYARSSPENSSISLGGQLEHKAALEAYLEKKAQKLLSGILPTSVKSHAVVDVALSERSRQVTREELLPYGQHEGLPVGLLQRTGSSQQTAASRSRAANVSGNEETRSEPEPSQLEDSYEFVNGKQIERIESPMGAVERITVSVVATGPVPAGAQDALLKAVSRGLGLNPKRGDDISIVLMPQFEEPQTNAGIAPPERQPDATDGVASGRGVAVGPESPDFKVEWIYLAGLLLTWLVLVLVWLSRRVQRDPERLASQLRSLLHPADGGRG